MSDYYRNLSLILSRVMDDIGVSEEIVMRWRRTHLISENTMTLLSNLTQYNFTHHMFGSQTEGTTTLGLQSDTDLLLVSEDFNVIHDWKDWVPGKRNLLMIQNDVLRPGYCKLQRLRDDMPLAMDVVLNDEMHMYDERRRVLMKSRCFASFTEGFVSHGPALNTLEPETGSNDFVFALPSSSLSNQYKEWSSRQRPSNWPTLDMIEYMGNTRCFVVPYVHPDEERPNVDWRISTSLAERFMMFSLNITQIRCYVLLKMIVKTFIEPYLPDVISSYICKTLLFHCLERTRRDFWIEPNLVQCVNHVLLYMLAAVHTKDCPNYFNEASNLFTGKIDQTIQEQLLPRIANLVESRGHFLLRIDYDNLSCRLTYYIRNRHLMMPCHIHKNKETKIPGRLVITLAMSVVVQSLQVIHKYDQNETPIERYLTIVDFAKKDDLQHRTAVLMIPFICSYLATVDASRCILSGQDISTRTLQLYRLSLRFDAASSRLKYVSFLYCTGQFQDALSVLQDLERRLIPTVVHVCPCIFKTGYIPDAFDREARQNPYPSSSSVALCVMFTKAEIQCCPREMQFEFYRSTEQDKLHRNKYGRDSWMDLAVLDCLPYLYYLQYMTARYLGQQDLQYRALQNLESRVCSEEDFGHRETAYNILGQCLELENNMDRALMYYRMSLQVRPRHNAARLLLSRLGF